MTKDSPGRDLNVRQAARLLGVDENTVRNMTNDGRLACYRLPGSGFRRFRRAEVLAAKANAERLQAEESETPSGAPSYHDLHVTTDEIPRTSIFDLPYNLEVSCMRTSGWTLWDHDQRPERVPGSTIPLLGPRQLAGEYHRDPDTGKGGLRLDVAGFVICDSLTTPVPTTERISP